MLRHFLKKFSLALILMGLSLNSLAYSNISVPSFDSTFEIYLTGLLLRATNDDLDYHGVGLGSNFADILGALETISPGYVWGYEVGAGYRFKDTGNDTQLAYRHFDSGEMTGPLNTITQTVLTLPITDTTSSIGKTNFKLDRIDLDVGQYLTIEHQLTLRTSLGASYLDLRRDFETAANESGRTITRTSTLHVEDQNKSSYQGAGPQFTLGGNYDLGSGFGLDGKITGALYIGNSEAQGRIMDTAIVNGIITDNIVQENQKNNTIRVVPNLGAKFGLNYSHQYGPVKMNLAAGYLVDHYYNVIDRINEDAATALIAFTTLFPPVPLPTHKTSDVAFDGPYISLKASV